MKVWSRPAPRNGEKKGPKKMANKDEETPWNDATTGAAANDEWGQEVDAEVKIALEVEGDGFIGRYMGMDDPGNGIYQAHFTNVTYLNGAEIAPSAFTNASTDLRRKLEKVPVKSMVRAEWVSSMDTGHESGNKMRVFRVQWK